MIFHRLIIVIEHDNRDIQALKLLDFILQGGVLPAG